MADVPNFGGLAAQQNTANNAATNLTNQANRPNQTNAMGSTTWSMNPDGTWSNNSSLSGPAQGLFDQTMQGQSNLTSQVGQGLDYSSLGQMPQVGSYSQPVINAWNALQQPGLDQQATAYRNRLAAQGITQGSTISNNAERNIGNTWTDASNKAILAGYQQGNTEFGQALQARQQGASELQNKYQAAQQGIGTLGTERNSLDPNAWNTKVPTSAAYVPQTIYGAAQDTFNAQRQNENADIAAQQAKVDSGVSALRAAGGVSGVTSGIGSLMSGAGSLWSGAQNLWNNWTLPAPNYGTDYSSFGGNLAANTGTWNTGSFY